MRIATLSLLAFLVPAGTAMSETYELDPSHTEVRFLWNHAGLTTQSGEWTKVSGEVEFDADNPAATLVRVEIDATSLHSGFPELDNHLKGGDFFDVESHPTITFVSTGAVQTGADTLRLTGDITVKGQSTPAVLDVTLTFRGEHPLGGFADYYKGEWIGVEATSSVLRSDLGVGLFAPLTSDAVQIEISSEMRAGGWSE